MSGQASRGRVKAIERQDMQSRRAIVVADPNAAAIVFSIGDVVVPRDPADDPLTSGANRYDDAIVVSVSPFALASREANMLWTASVKPEGFRVVGRVSAQELRRPTLRMSGGGDVVFFDVAKVRAHAELLVAEGVTRGDVAWYAGRNDEWQRLLARARTGARLLAALEGQPSECQACKGLAWAYHDEPDGVCKRCHGTGHNLHGVLPLIKWSPVVRRKVADATSQPDHANEWDGGVCWVDRLERGMPFAWGRLMQAMFGDQGPELHAVWREVQRGEHRKSPSGVTVARVIAKRSPFDTVASLDERITDRYRWHDSVPKRPRWRHGEITNAISLDRRRARTDQARIEDGLALDRLAALFGVPSRAFGQDDASVRAEILRLVRDVPGVVDASVEVVNDTVRILATAMVEAPNAVTITFD